MTPPQLDTTTAFLSDRGCGVYTSWRYDDVRNALPQYVTAFKLSADHVQKLPRVLCKVR